MRINFAHNVALALIGGALALAAAGCSSSGNSSRSGNGGGAKNPTGGPIVQVSCSVSGGSDACATVINNTSDHVPAGELYIEFTNKLPTSVVVDFKIGSSVVASQRIAPNSDRKSAVDLKTKGTYTITTTTAGKTIFNPGGGLTN